MPGARNAGVAQRATTLHEPLAAADSAAHPAVALALAAKAYSAYGAAPVALAAKAAAAVAQAYLRVPN